ncbi:glycosyltransferase [Thiocapsa bogorovii]|uniref:glycosyltransferase n=1 Tax=Thiocapsa bogorovii TaxID=521689 RepID=UPI001E4F677F|nr:glycosyltransferase [Thiocapsa bogorovii]UHD14566.1 glycosyltransferase [Thiocapsa bogorovii]
MKLLIVTHGSIFRPDHILSGNSIRAYYLGRGLVEHGIHVTFAYPRPQSADPKEVGESDTSEPDSRLFGNSTELHALIREVKPEAILVGYWELLDFFPYDFEIPLIVDLIAPRILEILFQDGEDVNHYAGRMLAQYRKASRFICGTRRQRQFLIPWLILAGFDCRFDPPIDIIPISTEPVSSLPRQRSSDTWTLVTGGVSWPWRMAELYHQSIRETLAEGSGMRGRLLVLSGGYVHKAASEDAADSNGETAPDSDSAVESPGLLPYRDMVSLFRDECDIGIELSDYNIERDFSASFRSVEFLRCALPVICNRSLALASDLLDYDAGWVIDGPEDLPALLESIARAPADYSRKSANAIRLVDERYHYLKTIRPLVEYLKHLKPPEKQADWLFIDAEPQLDRLNQQILDLDREVRLRDTWIEELRHHVEKLQNRLDEILKSTSWRLTEPLRNGLINTRGWIGSLRYRAWQAIRLAWEAPEPSEAFHASRGRYAQLEGEMVNTDGARRAGYVAIVSREDIFPTNHGAAVKIERTAWGLSHFVDGVLLISSDWGRYYLFKSGIAEEHLFPRPIRLTGLMNRFSRKKILRSGMPLNEAYLYQARHDWSFSARLLYLAFKYRIILYQAEFPAYVRPCLQVNRMKPATTLLVEHNVECDRIRTQYPQTTPQAYDWLRKLEIDACNRVDHVVAVSEPDRDLLIAHGVDSRKVQVVPHGVDLRLFDRDYSFGLRDLYDIPASSPIIVYHGIYSYRPNLESVELLASEILPRLSARGIDARVFAIGPEPPAESPHPDVVFTGSVENLAPYLKSADIAVVPLQKGGGTRMKILEYFAASVPVVATRKGIEGIPAQQGVHALIEDDFDGMADAIVWLLEHPKDGQDMAARSKAYVDTLDWTSIAKRYLDLLKPDAGAVT